MKLVSPASFVMLLGLVALLVYVFWTDIVHVTAAGFAGLIAYRILRHRYFPKTERERK